MIHVWNVKADYAGTKVLQGIGFGQPRALMLFHHDYHVCPEQLLGGNLISINAGRPCFKLRFEKSLRSLAAMPVLIANEQYLHNASVGNGGYNNC